MTMAAIIKILECAAGPTGYAASREHKVFPIVESLEKRGLLVRTYMVAGRGGKDYLYTITEYGRERLTTLTNSKMKP